MSDQTAIPQRIGAIGKERSACGQLGPLATDATEHATVTCPQCQHWVAGRNMVSSLVDLVSAAMVAAVGGHPGLNVGLVEAMRPTARQFLNDSPDLREGVLAAAAQLIAWAPPSGQCRVCGCTDDDCTGCVERTGQACTWVESNLCSACIPTEVPA
jgi:hypothetical protein